MNALRRIWGDNTDVLLVVLVLGVITILFAPIPAACSISSSSPT
jgi:hypothetical protein